VRAKSHLARSAIAEEIFSVFEFHPARADFRSQNIFAFLRSFS